ncbi:hypothetical protein [Pectobacterium versatile]|uniref:hypothetical protein n=1 Tax=Pectobacterium versatile TaxID=2488639 RepID=UPI0019606081|nr:hypothetical protein [Pectobacterium versatile]
MRKAEQTECSPKALGQVSYYRRSDHPQKDSVAGWESTTQVGPARCLEGRGNMGVLLAAAV